MQHEVKKLTLIVNELISYLMTNDSGQIDVSIVRKETESIIHVAQHGCTCKPTYIEQLDRELNVPRQHEIEGYYWQLVGENDSEEELCLVGAMTDEVKVTFSEGQLNIDMVRKY